MTSETVFVVIYHEDGEPVDFLGVFKSLDAAKRSADQHFRQYHPKQPTWLQRHWGAEAVHDRARYIVRELEVIDH